MMGGRVFRSGNADFDYVVGGSDIDRNAAARSCSSTDAYPLALLH